MIAGASMDNLRVDCDEKTSLLRAAEDGSVHADDPSFYSTAASAGDGVEMTSPAEKSVKSRGRSKLLSAVDSPNKKMASSQRSHSVVLPHEVYNVTWSSFSLQLYLVRTHMQC